MVPTVAAFQGGLVTGSGWLQRFQSFVMLYISSNALRCVCIHIYTYTYVYTFFIILQPSDSGFVFYNSNRLLSVALHLS